MFADHIKVFGGPHGARGPEFAQACSIQKEVKDIIFQLVFGYNYVFVRVCLLYFWHLESGGSGPLRMHLRANVLLFFKVNVEAYKMNCFRELLLSLVLFVIENK